MDHNLTRHPSVMSLRARIALSLLVVFVCAVPMTAMCQSPERDEAARLTKIRGDVSATEATLAQIKSEFGKLKKEERGLEAEVQKLTFEEQALVERSAQVAHDRDAIVAQVKVAEQHVDVEREKIRGRLRSLYINTATSTKGILLASLGSKDIERIAVYSRSVRSNDERRFQDVKRAVEALTDARRRLDASLEESQRLQNGVQVKRSELEDRRRKLKAVMEQVQERQNRAKATLTLLMQEARKLEDIVRSMTGGEGSKELDSGSQPVTDGMPSGVTPTHESPASGVIRATKSADVMHPEGLFGKSVRVVYPVKGDVLQRFGKMRVADFSDMIFSKGLEYKTAEGSQVRAVLGGRVAFVGAMPGFDTVVILDHGMRSYSLYGRLGKSFVTKGDLVSQRDPVGVTSAPDNKGRNFYFETRKNGSPVDPSTVLARAS